jgi:putative ABC transport system permease protein
MKIKSLMNIVLKNILRNRMRTIINMVIIVVGILVFMITISLSNGIAKTSKKQILENSSLRKITVSVDVFSDNNQVLQMDFIQEMNELQHVDVVYPDLQLVAGIYNKENECGVAYAKGLPSKALPKIQKGEPFKENETKVLIIPEEVTFGSNTYDGEEFLGKVIKLEYNVLNEKEEQDVKYYEGKVVGVYSSSNKDIAQNQIYIPMEDMIVIQAEKRGLTLEAYHQIGTYQNAFILVDDEQYVESICSDIESHGFSTYSIHEELNTVPGIVKYIMVIGGLITALVFGSAVISISATIAQATKNRRKEIGIMKAIGYSTSDVIKIFLAESVIVSVIAGVIGLILSKIILLIIENRVAQNEQFHAITMEISLENIIIVLAVCLFIPIIAGVYPLLKGANIAPSQALRSE